MIQATPMSPPGCCPGTAWHHRVLGYVQEIKVGWELPWPGSSTSTCVSGTVGPSPLLILACFQGGALTLKSKSCGLQDFAQTPSQASLCPGFQAPLKSTTLVLLTLGSPLERGSSHSHFSGLLEYWDMAPLFLSAFPTL